MGERGVGGSKCGATAAVALLFPGERGTTQLLAANVGDARVLLCRRGKAVQLTVDHVPDRYAWKYTEVMPSTVGVKTTVSASAGVTSFQL